MTGTAGKLHETITLLMNDRVRLKFAGEDLTLNSSTCIQIYTTIFDTITEIFNSAKIKVTNELVNYISQEYYDTMLINGKHHLDPSIFTQRAKLENIETEEIKFLAVYFRGTPYFEYPFKELKKRV